MVEAVLLQTDDLPAIWYPDNDEITRLDNAFAALAADPLDQDSFNYDR